VRGLTKVDVLALDAFEGDVSKTFALDHVQSRLVLTTSRLTDRNTPEYESEVPGVLPLPSSPPPS
jgi:hypothetical protein